MIIRKKMRLVIVLGSALTLTGCVTPGQMQARHSATCQSYGFMPGSEGYAFCMLQLDLADHGYSHHGVGQASWPYPPPPYGYRQAPPPPPPSDTQQTPPQSLR